MLQPTRLISTPFAQEGEKTEIQNVTGEFDNSATYQLGFPPLTMQSIRLGGKPPKGTDFNGILFDITENISFLCKGGRYQYNAGLSTLIGGYPEGSNLLLDDNVTEVVSTVAGNQNNPNTDMTGWTFKPNRTTAEYVLDASEETQQQVNYNGGAKWHSRVGGYQKNERVVLANGDIVKSTINGNTNDPNVNMTGWQHSNLTPSKNLNDVLDKAQARTNLGVYSKAETDSIAGTPNATETIAGKAKIATTAIAQAGTNDTDIITSKKLRDVLNATGGASVIAFRAWATIDGTTGIIKKGLGFASVSKVATGQFVCTPSISPPDVNYAVFLTNMKSIIYNPSNTGVAVANEAGSKTTTSFKINATITSTANAYVDNAEIFIGVIY